jgi:nitrogen fixation-related uncharacterized protein
MCPNCILNQTGLMPGLYVAFGICGVFFVVALAAMLWAFRNGEFENIEDTKFEMLDDSEDGVLAKQAKEAAMKARRKEGPIGGTR